MLEKWFEIAYTSIHAPTPTAVRQMRKKPTCGSRVYTSFPSTGPVTSAGSGAFSDFGFWTCAL